MTETDLTARAVVVHGRVQGVFFRDRCRSEADDAGVDGWVSNEPDGTLHAHFEGPGHAVDRMVSWVHQGPDRANVARVEVTEVEPKGHRGFEVR